MYKSFFIVIAIGIVLALIVNNLLQDPYYSDPIEKINNAIQSNQEEIAEVVYLDLVTKHPYNLDYNYGYINTHFDLPKKKKIGKNQYKYRDDIAILEFYESKVDSGDSKLIDIGNYGLGLISVNLDNYQKAKNLFLKVKNKELKYLNNSIGNVYLNLGNDKEAKKYFTKEIEIGGNIDGATSNLSRLLLDEGDYQGLKNLITNTKTESFVPEYIKRKLHFKQGHYFKYVSILLSSIFTSITLIGFIGATIILFIWIIYMRKLDIYEPETWKYIMLSVGLGMLFSFLTFLLSDFNQEVLGFELNGKPINDLFYSIIGIGAIEEFVKIIPLLILIKYSDAVNESYDYIFYASLSALGFAFMENLIYFSENQLYIISARAILTSVGHMFMSSIIAYAFVLNKYRYKEKSWLRVLYFFILASLFHGFYDFWLINEKVSSLRILSIVSFLSGIFIWNSMKNNALNHSEFFNKERKLNHQKLSEYLMYGLSSVVLFEYLALSFKFGPTAGNHSLFESFYSGAYLIAFVSSNLGQFKINRDKWENIRLWGTNKPNQSFNKDRDLVINKRIQLAPFSNNQMALQYVPNKGTVIKRCEINEYYNWYLLKLENDSLLEGFQPDYVFIRPKKRNEVIAKSFRILVGTYLIKSNIDINKEEFGLQDLEFVDWTSAIRIDE